MSSPALYTKENGTSKTEDAVMVMLADVVARRVAAQVIGQMTDAPDGSK